MSTPANPATAQGRTSKTTTASFFLIAFCFLAVLLDGFDTASLAFSVPYLAQAWDVDASHFGTALVLTNLGVVGGYVLAGPISARRGERTVLVFSSIAYGAFTMLTAWSISLESMMFLNVMRALTGLGLGGLLPAAVSLATKYSQTRRKELVSVLVTLGLTTGLSLGGFVGGPLLRSVGPHGVFIIAGIAPIVVAVLIMLVKLPVLEEQPARQEAVGESKVSRLFAPDVRSQTVLLWMFAFLVFLVAYTITNWAPTLLRDFGFDEYQAPLGIALFSLGGLLGGIILIPLTAKIGIIRSMILMPLLGMIGLAGVLLSGGNTMIVFLTLCIAGAGLTASQIGQLTMAVSLYPMATRSTGVGWAAALGRMGSIVGPAVGGLLLAASLQANSILALSIVPIILALLTAFFIQMRSKKSQVTDDEDLVQEVEAI